MKRCRFSCRYKGRAVPRGGRVPVRGSAGTRPDAAAGAQTSHAQSYRYECDTKDRDAPAAVPVLKSVWFGRPRDGHGPERDAVARRLAAGVRRVRARRARAVAARRRRGRRAARRAGARPAAALLARRAARGRARRGTAHCTLLFTHSKTLNPLVTYRRTKSTVL